MIPEILDNLDFFSSLTQRTLSAFHFSGTDESLGEDINNIKKYVSSSKYKKIKNTKKLENNKYLRIFTDDTTDIVDFDNLTKPALISNPTISIIDDALNKSYNPITHIRYGSKIKEAHYKTIETSTEKLFFINMADCT